MSELAGAEPSDNEHPLVLGPEVLRKTPDPDKPRQVVPESRPYRPEVGDLEVARRTENECIYFDEKHSASWIIYPPRSSYSFVPRAAEDVTVIEFRRWTPMTRSVFHQLSLSAGCAEHGGDCPSNVALSLAVRDGYNPFG